MAKKIEIEKVVKVDYNGKKPPYSEQIEDIILGQILIDSEAINEVINMLKKEVFYVPNNQIIFEAIFELAKSNQPVDLITVSERLEAKEQLELVGGISHITELTLKVSSSANIESHAKILIQKYIQREIIKASSLICEKAFDSTAEISELTDYAESQIMSITEQNVQRRTYKDIKSVSELLYEKLLERRGKGVEVGISSGYPELDFLTSGWQKGHMIVIAARPAMGKTAFVLSMVRNIAIKQNKPIAMFSLEMSCEQLATRLFVGEARIPQGVLQKGDLDDNDVDRLTTALEKIAKAPIWLDDTPALSIYDFKSKCRKLKEKEDIQCVIVDYLQLMTAKGSFSREQEVSSISRQIKEIAMELQIPIIALAQLNRGLENRQGAEKEPRLADLRESGSIEQDADMVMFLNRRTVSLKVDTIEDENGVPKDIRKEAHVFVSKNRHGSQGKVELVFEGNFMSFENLQEDELQKRLKARERRNTQTEEYQPSTLGFSDDKTDANDIFNQLAQNQFDHLDE